MRNIINTISPVRMLELERGDGVIKGIDSHLPDKGNNVQNNLLSTDFIKMKTFSS